MIDDTFTELLHKDISFQIIAAVYEVHNILGYPAEPIIGIKQMKKALITGITGQDG